MHPQPVLDFDPLLHTVGGGDLLSPYARARRRCLYSHWSRIADSEKAVLVRSLWRGSHGAISCAPPRPCPGPMVIETNSLANKSSRRYRVPIRYSLSNQKHPESPMLPDVIIQSMGGLDFRQKGVFKMPPDSASATPLRDTVGMTPWGDLR